MQLRLLLIFVNKTFNFGLIPQVRCLECPEGYYGDCTQQCDCDNGASCDREDGTCHCEPGFVGDKCQNECDPWKHGTRCTVDCLCNREHTESCNNQNGQCTCKSGYQVHKTNTTP